jgi:NAD(P)-dependent dehydrogenase (short-subunit alcohol dehydrogenase family)
VRQLADSGASVVVADLDEAAGSEVAHGAGASFVQLDVASAEGWSELAGGLPRLDLAFLNAGVSTGASRVEDVAVDDYQRLVRVNVDGVVLGVRSLLPVFRRSGGGSIVVTASIYGLIPMMTDPLYTLTKHALVGFVRAVAPELERSGVSIAAVCPDLTDTPFLQTLGKLLRGARFPLLRPEDVAGTALGLAAAAQSGSVWCCRVGVEPHPVAPPELPRRANVTDS